MMSLPTLYLDMDRTRINQVGLNAQEVAQSVLVSLSGSFQTAPNFWLNPRNGVSYNIAIQTPQYHMTSLQDLMNTPVTSAVRRPRKCSAIWRNSRRWRVLPWSTITTCSRSSMCMPARRGAIWAEWRRTS